MSPPPPEKPAPSVTEAGTRRVLERLDIFSKQVNTRLDDLEGHVDQLQLRIRKRPTMQKVLITIGGSVAVIIALVWNVTWLVSTRTADASGKAVEVKLESFEQKIEARIQKSDQLHQTEHRELYETATRKKRSTLLERPVPKLDGGTPRP